MKNTMQRTIVRSVGCLLLLTIFSIMSACASSQNSTVNNNNNNSGSSNTQTSSQNNSNGSTETHDFTISGNTPPTLIVNNDVGSVQVQPASSSNNVHVQITKSGGNPSDIQVNYTQGGNTLTVTIKRIKQDSTAKADANITVPSKSDLQLQDGTGDITVTGIQGKMLLTNGTGNITATQVTLTSNSQLQTDTGSVNFSGSIGSGSYEFQASTGSVNVSLPSNASFHVNANTNVGSISSDFSDVAVQQNIAGASASGSVGSSPSATVTITTNTGSINLQKH